MRFAPISDVLIIITARDRAAHDQEQHLAQRISDLPGLPRILNPRQVIEQHPQLRLGRPDFHWSLPNRKVQGNQFPRPRERTATQSSQNSPHNPVNLTSPPWPSRLLTAARPPLSALDPSRIHE